MKSKLKSVGKFIQGVWFDVVDAIKFWKAKRLANKLHEKWGKRFHVVPSDETTIIVIDGDGLVYGDDLRLNGMCWRTPSGNKIPFTEIMKKSYYSTSVNSPVLRERAKAK